MSGVIDSLIVELGLDPKKFNDDRKKTAADFLRQQEEMVAQTKKTEEKIGDNIAGAFKRLEREVVAFLAVLYGARTISDFVSSAVAAEQSLSLLSATVGAAPHDLSAFSLAAERAGGSVAGAQSDIANFTKMLTDVNLNHGAAPLAFYEMGLHTYDPKASPFQLLSRLPKSLEKFKTTEDRMAHLSAIGLHDPGVMKLLSSGQASAEAQINDARGSAITDAQAASGERLGGQWAKASQGMRSFGNELLEVAEGPLTGVLTLFGELIEKNKPWIEEYAAGKMKEFATFVEGLNWTRIYEVIGTLCDLIANVVTALGGIENTLSAIIAIWAGGKAGMLASGLMAIVAPLAPGAAALLAAAAALGVALEVYSVLTGQGLITPSSMKRSIRGKAGHGGGAHAATLPAPGGRGSSTGSVGDVDTGHPMPVKVTNLTDDILKQVGTAFGFGDNTGKGLHTIGGAGLDAIRAMTPTSEEVKALMASGDFPDTPAGHEAWIRVVAAKYGLNPDMLVGIARAEGNNPTGWRRKDQGSSVDVDANGNPYSFGDFQFNMHPGALGDRMLKSGGPDARDHSTWKQQADWAARYIAAQGRRGLRDWTDPFAKGWGPNVYQSPGGSPLKTLGPASSIAAREHLAQSTMTVHRHIHIASIPVHAHNAHAQGISAEIKRALERELATSGIG